MTDQTPEPEPSQRIVVRFDLATAGSVYRRATRPPNRRRQKLVRFVGAEGTEERFEVIQTVPLLGHADSRIPTDRQYGAVADFYGLTLPDHATQLQAHMLLCVRDYAAATVSSLSYTAARKGLIARFVAAYIANDRGLRNSVSWWCEDARDSGQDIRSGIALHRPHRQALRFAEKLVLDVRGAGSEAFG